MVLFVIVSVIVRLIIAGLGLCGMIAFGWEAEDNKGWRAWVAAGGATVCFFVFWLSLLLPV